MSTAKQQELGNPYSEVVNYENILPLDHEFNESVISKGSGIYQEYYGEFCKLYLANMNLVAKVKFLNNDVNFLKAKINMFEQKQLAAEHEEAQKSIMKTVQKEQKSSNDLDKLSANSNNDLKRKRKKKGEVERAYICSFPTCGKGYGSENSLNQHIKFKHYDFWINQRKMDSDKQNTELVDTELIDTEIIE